MSDDDPIFEQDGTKRNDRVFRREGHLDFFQTHGKRRLEAKPVSAPGEGEASGDILAIVEQMKGLVEAYAETAQRVGKSFDGHVLRRVVDALQRESFGERDPLESLKEGDATEQFLTQSLYGELLEVPVPLSGNGPSTLGHDDWTICLDFLIDAFSEPTISRYYAN
ncbi:MAG: hypothetical protein P1U68_18360 [Verrucomicrobiales bacterium]|nr:hypothetical protein [Verrucomicrobiales bacterium]